MGNSCTINHELTITRENENSTPYFRLNQFLDESSGTSRNKVQLPKSYGDNTTSGTIYINMTISVLSSLEYQCSKALPKRKFTLVEKEEFNEFFYNSNPHLKPLLKEYESQLLCIKESYKSTSHSGFRLGYIRFETEDKKLISYYNGSFDDKGLKNGYGEEFYSDNSIYMGLYQNGQYSYEGLLLSQNGDYYLGNFYLGNTVCRGKLLIKDCLIYEGEFKNSMKNGIGKEVRKDGTVYEGEFVDNAIEGKGIMKFLDGSFYTGTFKKGFFEGYGEYTWIDGRKYKGEFKNNKMEGEGVYCWPNGSKYEGRYHIGKKSGSGTFTWPNGNWYKGSWMNDLPHGMGKIGYGKEVYECIFRYGKVLSQKKK